VLARSIRRAVIFVHRWLGVCLSLVFLLWFLSGIGMMYWDFPSVQPADRLERAPALDGSLIRISPADAASRVRANPSGSVRVNVFDGRPVYRFGEGVHQKLVYADTGEERREVTTQMVERVASAWSGLPSAKARVEAMQEPDQWTVQLRLQDLKPLWKYSWPDGQQVYVSQASGEVVQYTTTASRWGAYVGAIPHWLYFAPLRRHPARWSRIVISTSAIGTVTALLGLIVGIWVYSPRNRYRYGGTSTAIPYRRWKRWHTIVGLVFGAGALTWAFSGMLSMDPFPAQQTGTRDAIDRIVQALRGRAPLEIFDRKSPSEALGQLAPLRARELELVALAGDPAYLVTIAPGVTRIIPISGPPQPANNHQRFVDVLRRAAEPSGGADISLLQKYDRYYLDRRGALPLPVILVRLRDAAQTRVYVDPKTASVVGSYSSKDWINRWAYHGLHSLDFPWLYAYRPLWDVVVITLMAGGTLLCLTSTVLAWRVVKRKVVGHR